MGAGTTKHATIENEGRFAAYSKRRSLRNSLRSTRGSTKDVFSSTDKYLQSLNDDFENGVIYHKKLAELRKIEREVNDILRDLQNFEMINNSSSKRFELENTAKYLRNKLKSTIDTHMGSAIRKLNNTPSESTSEKSTTQGTANIQQETDVQVITETDQVAAKLRETSIKLREVLGLLSSMDAIDQITQDSVIKVLNQCKADLYHMQPKTEKHLLKRSKCFRKIDEIRTILLGQKLGMFDSNPDKMNKTDVNESENCESDACGIEGDNEDNGEAEEKEVLQSNKSGQTLQEKSFHNAALKETNVVDGDANMDKLKTLKTTLKSIRNFFLSSSEISESTRKPLEEMLENSENQLRTFKPSNSMQQKKKTRYLKEVEEMKITLQRKYGDSSDEENNTLHVVSHSVTENKNDERIPKQSVLDQNLCNNKRNDFSVKGNYISPDDKKNAQFTAFQTNLFLVTEKLSETFNKTLNLVFHISNNGSNTTDLNTVTQNLKDMERYFIDVIELLTQNKENAISNHVMVSQPRATYNGVSEIQTDLPNCQHTHQEVPITNLSKAKQTDNAIRSKTSRGRSSPDLFSIDEKVGNSGQEIEYIRAAASMFEYSTNDCKVSVPTSKDFRQSSSLDELETVRKSHEAVLRYNDPHSMLDSSEIKLVSMRNIDLSQLASSDITCDLFAPTQNVNTISTRNIDLSQLVSRESDSSLLESYEHHFDCDKTLHAKETLQLTITDSSPEDGIVSSFPLEAPDLTTKKFHQSFSVDELETLRKAYTHDEQPTYTDLYSILQPTKTQLISTRNIDLSRVGSSDLNSDPQSKIIQNTDTISTRNVDVSQFVSRESDSSLLERHLDTDGDNQPSEAMETIELPINKSFSEDGIFISFAPREKQVNKSPTISESLSIEDSSDPLKNCQNLGYNQNESTIAEPNNKTTEKLSDHQASVISTIESAETKLELLKKKIMNFIGLKTSELYNELDEELVQVMMMIDCLKIKEEDPLKEKRENIVKDICKYSILLERKHLDHDFLDHFEKEVSMVADEMRQSLAKQKLENLQNISADVADMISEIENKIVDHLLIERRENCIKRLESIKGKLNIFLK